MALKLTLAQALELLKAAGAPVAEIVTDEAQATPDFKQDVALSEIDKARMPIIRPQIEAEVKDGIIGSTTGKVAGTFKSALARAFKATGISRNELDNFKSEDEMLAHLVAKHNETFGKDTEALRNQLEDVTATHASTLAAKEQEWHGKVTAAEAKFIDRDIQEQLTAIVKEIPRTGGSEAAQAKQLMSYLRDQYHIHYDQESRKISLRDKTNPEKMVFANAENTRFLEPKEMAQTFLTELGVVAKDTRNQSAQGAMNNNNGNQNNNNENQQQQQSRSTGLNPSEMDIATHIDNLIGGGNAS